MKRPFAPQGAVGEFAPGRKLLADEADALLTVLRGGDSRASRLNEMVLRFFSEANSGHAMRLKAGLPNAHVIPLPHLTLFATGIPRFVYGALSEKALENGLLGRCLFIETDEFRPLGDPQRLDLPPVCVEIARMMVAREKRFAETGVLEPVTVVTTADGRRKLAELRQGTDELSRRLFESDLRTAAALYCRLYEKAKKLAMLWAISMNPEQPQMTADAVIWGSLFAAHVTRKMLYEAQFNVSEGKFDRLKKRALGILAKHGGSIPLSTLLKNLHVDANTMQRILPTLHMCDLIEEERIDRRKVIITLKTAA